MSNETHTDTTSGEDAYDRIVYGKSEPDVKSLVAQFRRRSPGLELAAATACEAAGALLVDRIVLRATLPQVARAVGKVGASEVVVNVRPALPAMLSVLAFMMVATNNVRRYWDAEATVKLLRTPYVLGLGPESQYGTVQQSFTGELLGLWAEGRREQLVSVRELLALYICADFSPETRREILHWVGYALRDATEAAVNAGYPPGSVVPWDVILAHRVRCMPSKELMDVIDAADSMMTSSEWVSVPGLAAHLGAGALVALSRGIAGWKLYVSTFLQLPAFAFPVNADPSGDFVNWDEVVRYIDKGTELNQRQGNAVRRLWLKIRTFFSTQNSMSFTKQNEANILASLQSAFDTDDIWCA